MLLLLSIVPLSSASSYIPWLWFSLSSFLQSRDKWIPQNMSEHFTLHQQASAFKYYCLKMIRYASWIGCDSCWEYQVLLDQLIRVPRISYIYYLKKKRYSGYVCLRTSSLRLSWASLVTRRNTVIRTSIDIPTKTKNGQSIENRKTFLSQTEFFNCPAPLQPILKYSTILLQCNKKITFIKTLPRTHPKRILKLLVFNNIFT